MAQYDQQEIENYAFGSPLWAGQNDPVLVDGTNDEVFWDSFLSAPGGKGFARLDCEDNRTILLQKYANQFPNQPIVRSQLSSLWYMLMISCNQDFVDPQAEEVVREVVSPEVEYAVWIEGETDPETKKFRRRSVQEITDRRRADKGFAAFYAASSQAQRQTDDPMASANQQANIRDERANVNQALRDWAAEYQKLPVSECKRRMSPAVNPAGYLEFNRNFEAAMSAGLI